MSVLVLFSGGLDSTLLAENAHRSGILAGVLFFSWGQPSLVQEQRAVMAWASPRDVRVFREVIDLDDVGSMRGPGVGKSGPRVVTGRNGIFLARATAMGLRLGVSDVWFGPTADDQADYPDCRPAFVDAMSAASAAQGGPRIVAPLINMNKADVMAEAKALGVSVDDTWSCYTPRLGQPCGTCNSCVLRASV